MTEDNASCRMASISEHSYCVSMSENERSTPPEETASTVIQDLFENPTGGGGIEDELCPTSELGSLCTSIGFNSDVNFDGFNYSVPAVSADGDEIQEIVWSGAGASSGNASSVVEIWTNVDCNEKGNELNGKRKTEGGGGGAGGDTGIRKHVGSRRRRDFIQDALKRRKHFLSFYNKLLADFKRVCSRSGATGTLAAIFEGKPYDTDTDKLSSILVTGGRPADTTAQSSACVVAGTDDHRYAAPLVTQACRSYNARDHQYDETSSHSSSESEGCPPRDKGCRRRRNFCSDYIDIRWARTQIFCKIVQTLFRHKANLEERTRAEITLIVIYEGNIIDSSNVENVAKMIGDRREYLKSKRFNIASKSIQPQLIKPAVSSDHPYIPITLILPTSEVLPPYDDSSRPFTENHSGGIPSFSADVEINPGTLTASFPEPYPSNSVDCQLSVIPDPTEETFQGNMASFALCGQPGKFDAQTNTEPICAVCHNEPSQGVNVKPFWIRCNDPFCYYIVHAACLGFAVTHISHLKMLPGFYCELHRS